MLATWPTLQKNLNNVCVPPGNGVFTVNTAKERKETLHQAIFGQTEDINTVWKENLNQLPDSSKAVILGLALTVVVVFYVARTGVLYFYVLR